MSEYKRPKTEQEFNENFAQKKPLMTKAESFIESSRCLFCFDAPCTIACPTHIDIPLFIKQIHTNNVDGAAETIYEMNWMGNACGIICPTEVLCEGACVYNLENDKPLEIGRLQNYATHQAIEKNKTFFKKGVPNGKRIAIIGAGPSSIACACELATLGYDVEIFESRKQPSGLTAHAVAPYKITTEEALSEVAYLQRQLGFVIHYEHPVTTDDQIKEIEAIYDAIFLGVGIGPTSELQIKGENLPGVVGAVEWIEELRMKKHNMALPPSVIVLGGGNTAMDAASEAARMGVETVHLTYRRSKEDMPAYDFEYKLAIGSGVQSVFNVLPKEILGQDKATGVRFVRTVMKDGKLSEIEGSSFDMPCDLVIKATGQAKMGHFLQKISGLALDTSKRIVVDPITFQTGNPKYFAGGDAVNGGAEVVNSAYEGKQAAKGIHQYLKVK